MALVDPNIALSYRGIQLQDPLEQYGRITNIQSAQQAQQMNALKMEDMQRERDALAQIQSTIAAKGGPPDLRVAAQAMLNTGRPQFVQSALSILEKLDAQDQFNQYLRQIESPTPAPTNALTTAPTPAAPAPINALVTPTSSLQDLEKRYRVVSNINNPAAKAEAQLILAKINDAMRAQLPPDTIRTMTALGYPITPEGYQAFQSAQRPPQQAAPLVPVLQNGKPILVPRDQAVGQTPFSPATVQVLGLGPGKEPPAPTLTTIQDPTNPNQMITIDARQYRGGGVGSPGVIGLAGKTPAATAAANKREEGQQQAGDILDTLEAAYADLDRMKAVPSQQRSVMSNVLSYVAGTGVGQVAGRAVGSEAQTQRDIIQSSRNQLLNAVKNATGMSAQQLNSNVEFRSWLEALSDPTRSIEANKAILGNMRRFIANNTKKDEAATPAAARPSPAPKGAKEDPLGIR